MMFPTPGVDDVDDDLVYTSYDTGGNTSDVGSCSVMNPLRQSSDRTTPLPHQIVVIRKLKRYRTAQTTALSFRQVLDLPPCQYLSRFTTFRTRRFDSHWLVFPWKL